MQMGQFRLRSFVNEEREGSAPQVLIVCFHPEHCVGHLQQDGRIIGLVSLEFSGSLGQDVEGSLIVDLA